MYGGLELKRGEGRNKNVYVVIFGEYWYGE